MQGLKKLTITETIRLNRLHWFGHVKRMEENRVPRKVRHVNLEKMRLRGRPKNKTHYNRDSKVK